MPNLPSANVTISPVAGQVASGLGLCCVIAPVATAADVTPRQYGNSAAIYAKHGYSEGLDYAHTHLEVTRKPVLFVGIPIVTPGVVGRINNLGSTGTSVASVSGTPLGEHTGRVRVLTGGTVGTTGIVLGLSLDGGRSEQSVRLGAATTYVVPYYGVTLSFSAGTLVAGDTILTWHGTAPRGDAAGWTAARTALASQGRLFRTALLCGDLQSGTEGAALLAQINAYKTANQRYSAIRASVKDWLPGDAMSRVQARMTGSPSVTYAEVGATGDTITRAAGSWITDGFAVGDTIVITGSASNNITAVIASLSATVITLGTEDLTPETTTASTIVAYPTLTFAEVGASGDTITRNRGSWLDDGFRAGDTIAISGTASNNVTGAITGATATVLTMGTTDLNPEVIRTSVANVTGVLLATDWMAALDADYTAQITTDTDGRLRLSAGRGFTSSPSFAGWYHRRPAGWFASWRAYQHDVHIATWRKSDGPVGAGLYDADGTLVEWDDRVQGGAGVAARFTTLRSWGNGPAGAFIALDLSRASSGLLEGAHNGDVVNLLCTVCQSATEEIVGRGLELQDNGTATTDALATITTEVNAQLELAGRTDELGEGKRCSSVSWTPSTDDVLNVAEPILTGVLRIQLLGTIHTINTTVRVLANGLP